MQIVIDIQKKLELDFGSESSLAKDELEALYTQTNWRIGNRMVRSIVYLSNGDFESLKKAIKHANTDYKEVLWLAEYDRGDEQLRDFNKTFEALGLL
ncbi:MAG: hypothetical protein ACI9T9_002476 [Oleiphilaceae bacterium]|jgi:hypothetical protein